MDRTQQAIASNLMDREEKIIADVLERFRNLILVTTERITNKASIGQAAYHSMTIDIETQGMIKSVEDLLALTRQLRELWVVGPLRKPGEGEREAEEQIDTEVQKVVQLLNQIRGQSRQKLVSEGGGFGEYAVGSLEPLEAARVERAGEGAVPTSQQQASQS